MLKFCATNRCYFTYDYGLAVARDVHETYWAEIETYCSETETRPETLRILRPRQDAEIVTTSLAVAL